jgi:HlyD family secretion protein
MKNKKYLLILSIPVIIIIVAVIILLVRLNRPVPKVFIGVCETTEVNVSSEIPGRIDSILVDKGDMVKKGEVLYTLETDIMDAKMGQAKGVLKSADNLVKKAEKGAREEEIKAAGNQYEMAKSQYEFAKKTYKRFQLLFADSIISRQEMDELEFKYNASKEQMEAAKAIYDMAKKGVRHEDIEMAKGQLEQARNVYNEAEAFYRQLRIIAPVSGEISAKIAEEGEVMGPGYPVLTIQIPEKIHAVVNVREDYLDKFKKGGEIEGKVPGLGYKDVKFVVSYIAPLADFANWTPVKDKGELDLKSFEVHLKPVEKVDGLRPGMTVRFSF